MRNDTFLGTGIGVNFEYWRHVDAIKIGDSAAIMRGIDPRAIAQGEVVADEFGAPPDFTEELDQLTAAVIARTIAALPPDPASVDKDTFVSRISLALWLRNHGREDVADGLEGIASTQTAASRASQDLSRRLTRLRELGGSARNVGGRWRFTGVDELAEAEVADGRPRSSPKTIRADLTKAAEAEKAEGRQPPVFPSP